MGKKIAILEKTKTPYRPAVFESVGKGHDVRVFYAHSQSSDRQWDATHEFSNFDETEIWSTRFGPLVIPIFFSLQLLRGNYDEYVATSTSSLLLCSLSMIFVSKLTGGELTIWTEHIKTDWSTSTRGAWYFQIAQKFWRVFHRGVRKIIYREADRVIAFSDLAAKTAKQTMPDDVPLSIVPQAYPKSLLDSCERKISKDKFRIVFVGRLEYQKGVDILIKAVKNIDSPYELLIAGDGSEVTTLQRMAKENDNISFVGYITGEDKACLYKGADLLVLPSRHDAWGLVVNEALYFNTAVITTEAVGASMILDEDHVVPPNNISALQNAIQREMTSQSDIPQPPTVSEMAQPLRRDNFRICGEK